MKIIRLVSGMIIGFTVGWCGGTAIIEKDWTLLLIVISLLVICFNLPQHD